MSLILSGSDGVSDIDGTAATPAIRGTDANTGIFFPAADTIAFSEGGAEAMRIDSSSNVGIGTTSPNGVGKLAVKTSSTSETAGLAVISSANDSFLTIYNSGSVHNIGATYSSTGSYQPIAFVTSGSERMRIPAAGGVQAVTCVSVGNATPAASGAGITFPATQSASSDANTLDDYEEGSWTPTMVFSGGAGTLSYNTQDGFYTKIGRTVYFSMRLVFSKGTASGTLDNITGLPFSVTSTNGGGVYIDGMNSLTGAAQYFAQSTTLLVYMSGTGNSLGINATSMAASSNVLSVSGFYIT